MGILSTLFGRKEIHLEDDVLGPFSSMNVKDNKVVWQGRIEFLREQVSIFLPGTPAQFNAAERDLLLKTLNDEAMLEPLIDMALKEQYDNAGKEYTKWEDHFSCSYISVSGDEVEIAFEQHETFYHFNVLFVNNKVTGVSIDS